MRMSRFRAVDSQCGLLVAGELRTTGFGLPAFLAERSVFEEGILGEWMVQGGNTKFGDSCSLY
jgi:hypothetical protein